MFIKTEQTPNPNAMKFVVDVIINHGEQIICDRAEEADHTLVESLFDVGNITQVFLGTDFIVINKDEDIDWAILKPQILSIMMDFIISGGAADEAKKQAKGTHNEDGTKDGNAKGGKYNDPSEIAKRYNLDPEPNMKDPIIEKIATIIETRIKPAVAGDGGDIVFIGFKDGVVFVELRGACSGCPSSDVTLKDGIERMLQHYVPEVTEVENCE